MIAFLRILITWSRLAWETEGHLTTRKNYALDYSLCCRKERPLEKYEWESVLTRITPALGHSDWLNMSLYCSVLRWKFTLAIRVVYSFPEPAVTNYHKLKTSEIHSLIVLDAEKSKINLSADLYSLWRLFLNFFLDFGGAQISLAPLSL